MREVSDSRVLTATSNKTGSLFKRIKFSCLPFLFSDLSSLIHFILCKEHSCLRTKTVSNHNNNKHIRKDRYDGIAGFKMMVKRDVRAPIVYSLNASFFIWTLFRLCPV